MLILWRYWPAPYRFCFTWIGGDGRGQVRLAGRLRRRQGSYHCLCTFRWPVSFKL